MQLHAHEGPWVAKKLEGTLFTERDACGQYTQLKVLADRCVVEERRERSLSQVEL